MKRRAMGAVPKHAENIADFSRYLLHAS